MKSLLILALTLALIVALFFTRPHKADFEKFARDNKLTDTHTTGGPSIAQKINQQLQTFSSPVGISFGDPTEEFLKKCTYDNYLLWVNVKKDNQVIYTGAIGHWFQRSPSTAPATAK
jgi:hypothetical protein